MGFGIGRGIPRRREIVVEHAKARRIVIEITKDFPEPSVECADCKKQLTWQQVERYPKEGDSHKVSCGCGCIFLVKVIHRFRAIHVMKPE